MSAATKLHTAGIARIICTLVVSALLLWVPSGFAASTFDHTHRAWNDLLARHVQRTNGGAASVVDYAGFARERDQLQHYLDKLSAVARNDFDAWSKLQRRAFLINSYNAFTVDLILTKYPDLDSIKDLGGLFTSPWKRRFFSLLGKPRNLDDVEQDLLRGATEFDDPRIHFALNCASVGCPALRPEAYVADRLDAQLHDQAQRFLSDTSRNRFDPAAGTLTVSMIFKWYAEDFGKGFLDAHSVPEFVAAYPEAMHADAQDIARLRHGGFVLSYSNYDWSLNRAQ